MLNCGKRLCLLILGWKQDALWFLAWQACVARSPCAWCRSRVTGLLRKSRDCNPTWNRWQAAFIVTKQCFHFLSTHGRCEISFYANSWGTWKVDRVESSVSNLIQCFLDLMSTQRCWAHLSVFLHQECNTLFTIYRVYLFDLSCYRIVGEKKRCVKGLHTVSCNGNRFRMLTRLTRWKILCPLLGKSAQSILPRKNWREIEVFVGTKTQKSKLRDTELLFSCVKKKQRCPRSSFSKVWIHRTHCMTLLSYQTLVRMPDEALTANPPSGNSGWR